MMDRLKEVLALADGPLSARTIAARLGAPAAKGEINRLLYDNQLVFARTEDAVPRWSLRTSAIDAAPLPEQAGNWPPFEAAFRVGDLPAPLGQWSDAHTWPELLCRLSSTCTGFFFFPDPVLALDRPGGIRIHLSRVIDEVPRFVAWFLVCDRQVALAAAEHAWHLWRPHQPARWDRPDLLVGAHDTAAESPLVATWRCDEPRALAGAVLHLSHVGLATTRQSQYWLDGSFSDSAYRRWFKAAEQDLDDRRRLLASRNFAGWRNPVAGHCALCGRELRDPDSVRRGIGPDCWMTFANSGITFDVSETRADIPAARWALAPTLTDWRSRLNGNIEAELQRE